MEHVFETVRFLFLFSQLCLMVRASPLAGDRHTTDGVPAVKPRNNSIGHCDFSTSDWMSAVPDGQPMSLMSIPGTHDSCALYGGNYAECQTMSLPDQLNYGIRFLDIRCRVINGFFAIHHGIVYQKIGFGAVLDQCTGYLDQHPSESIFMRIHQEDSSASSQEFIQIFENYKIGRERYLFTENRIPTLGEARGRIVILADVDGLEGIPWASLNIQDDYVVPTIFDCGKKFDKVKDQLQLAVNEHRQGSQRLYINFCSGASSGAYPNAVADRVNPKVYDYLNGDSQCGLYNICYYGIVVLDFPGKYDNGITELLIKQNLFKLQQGCGI